MMSWFSVNYVNGRDVLKRFACSEAHQQAGDFVMHWYVNEMSKSIKYNGFKFDTDENNPRKTAEGKPNAQQVPNDMPLDAVAAFRVQY